MTTIRLNQDQAALVAAVAQATYGYFCRDGNGQPRVLAADDMNAIVALLRAPQAESDCTPRNPCGSCWECDDDIDPPPGRARGDALSMRDGDDEHLYTRSEVIALLLRAGKSDGEVIALLDDDR